jgi:hypothetical protein
MSPSRRQSSVLRHLALFQTWTSSPLKSCNCFMEAEHTKKTLSDHLKDHKPGLNMEILLICWWMETIQGTNCKINGRKDKWSIFHIYHFGFILNVMHWTLIFMYIILGYSLCWDLDDLSYWKLRFEW